MSAGGLNDTASLEAMPDIDDGAGAFAFVPTRRPSAAVEAWNRNASLLWDTHGGHAQAAGDRRAHRPDPSGAIAALP
jgi:hypothetical protein